MDETQDSLILVNLYDEITGFASKEEAHTGDGILHRAFSIFLFDDRGKLLLHERSQQKPLWPGFWTNSCCSHPRRGENVTAAASRRLQEELGVEASPKYVYKFHYKAKYLDIGSENENCSVFLARITRDQALEINREEISDFRWMTLKEVDRWIKSDRKIFTPWFLMEWVALRGEYDGQVEEFLKGTREELV